MVLQLYVWGPAFGLPSLDAECLAAIAYLAQSLGPADYQLIQASPSAVPTLSLPALYDPSTATWTSTFPSIATHLHSHPPPSFHPPTQPPTPTQTSPKRQADADATAYQTYLTAHAAPLLALSLYTSPANYAATTRPAYSAVLPFPLGWTEPVAARAGMVRRAGYLGVDLHDDDESSQDGDGGADGMVGGKGGWLAVPRSLTNRKKGVVGMLSPEQKGRIRLEGLAREVLDVLGEVEWEGQGLEVRCLAWGYLALMVVPEVPRPWLREVVVGGYPRLAEFVGGFKREVFAEGRVLPWAEKGDSAVDVGARFARAVACEVPLVGELWARWWAGRKKREVSGRSGTGGGLRLLLGAGLGLAAVGAGAFFYRGLPPFGAALQVWRRPAATLSSLGAAGAIFSGAFYGVA